ncbi:methyltransferase domain-containing protein [Tenggerimyces flavus]|uniref:TRM11 family SAM-dependent methyltransferase n=1 Tax=Tenggerimyces flavus TaxID=1708749 RepID=A0ABV7Y7U2_9ACTN|nr:methyltransferase domain-containing protein [Tenggerimyces flavus]MBM7788226.1 tRNA G10 N-methylase Trm11 [Tenggerimyces flavus]
MPPTSPTNPTTRMVVFAQPGLGPIIRRDLARVTGSGNDGRADILLCEVPTGEEHKLLKLRTAEDVFVEIGRTLRTEGDQPHWIAGRLLKPNRLERAIQAAGPKRASTFRVVARVLQERSFQRTALRRALADAVGKARPDWKPADPARNEIWCVEYTKGRFIAGLRVSGVDQRQHGGRKEERQGALRPTVAAAMLGLATDRENARILDPCCGSGTILAEAKARGWNAVGCDIDTDAVRIARRNVDRVDIEQGDVRDLGFDDASFDACVSNLPFGRQYEVQGDPTNWLKATLGELARVTKPGGRVVVLVPELPRAAVPKSLRLKDRHSLRLLGTQTTIWTYDRLP